MVCHGWLSWPNAWNTGGLVMVSPPMSICGRTPGACPMNATVPLRLLGIASSVSLVNRVADVVETTSTTGEAPETVTVSVIAPSFICMSIFATNDAVRMMPSRRTV